MILAPLPVRCSGCARVRWSGPEWESHPGPLQDEVAGLCPTCCAADEQEATAASWRAYRQVERKKERGFGPAPAGVDVFRGFKGVSE
jgi:hypothetical protein